MVSNKSVIFNSIPAGFPVPGEVSSISKEASSGRINEGCVPQTLKLFDSSLNVDAPLKGGEVLAKTVSLSLDPYLRGRMRSPEIKSYSQAFEVRSAPFKERSQLNRCCFLATDREAHRQLRRERGCQERKLELQEGRPSLRRAHLLGVPTFQLRSRERPEGSREQGGASVDGSYWTPSCLGERGD